MKEIHFWMGLTAQAPSESSNTKEYFLIHNIKTRQTEKLFHLWLSPKSSKLTKFSS